MSRLLSSETMRWVKPWGMIHGWLLRIIGSVVSSAYAEAAIGSNAIGPLTVESATAAEATTALIAAASSDFLFMMSPGKKKWMGCGGGRGERAPRGGH